MEDLSVIILSEVRDLRTALNSGLQETGERLSALETHMQGLVGNGQPGRIQNLEIAVTDLKRSKYYFAGIVTAVCTFASAAFTLALNYLRSHPAIVAR